MKVGDAVKLKFHTYGEKRRAKRQGAPVDCIGIVVESSGGGRKVIFPEHGKKIRTIVATRLEVVSCL